MEVICSGGMDIIPRPATGKLSGSRLRLIPQRVGTCRPVL